MNQMGSDALIDGRAAALFNAMFAALRKIKSAQIKRCRPSYFGRAAALSPFGGAQTPADL